jgi:acyl transferase domain-containing protein/phosphopantetheinyl transferase
VSYERRGLDIAVIGMACTFPGAKDLSSYWRNIVAGVDAIQDVPESRWDALYYDPKSTSADRFYCKRGGFIDDYADFDAAAFGIMPVAARGSEPDQLLALATAARALRDAGYENRPFSREKTGVVLGRGNYAGAGRNRLNDYVRTAEQIVGALRALLPHVSEEDLARVKHEFQSQLEPVGPDSAIGLVPNLTASRVSSRLDLHGPAFTVDAACASSLVAVDQACAELVSGRSDMMICGGVQLCHDETFWSVFTQLGALSRGEKIRPFDRRADGLLIGEGVGALVLKRREEAENADDRIYAVIRGTGVSSDGRGASAMVPRVEGQLLALERAWSAAGIDKKDVGLIEAHGTATPTGDEVEVRSLRSFFGDDSNSSVVLGSVKSMIGHTMAAAGVAGLIKTILAVHHRTLPPTLHCDEPREELSGSRFRVLSKSEPWNSEAPRLGGVSAFGFGGINAHVVVEEHDVSRPKTASIPIAADTEDLAIYSAATREALLVDLENDHRRSNGGSERLVIFGPSAERATRAREIVERGRTWKGREGIWYSADHQLSGGGKIAFVFPGVSASFEPRVDDIAREWNLERPKHTSPRDLEETGMGIVEVNRLLDQAVRSIGIVPDVIAGHSIGEWSGMVSSGILPDAELDAFVSTLKKGTLSVPGVVFAAAGCSAERAREAMQDLERIELSHDNCPHQVIFCGIEESVDIALLRLRDDGVLCEKLPFQSGFHSSLFADYLAPHRKHFDSLALQKPNVPLFSATTCERYPNDVQRIRDLAIDHLVKPVRFREVVERLHADGVRVLVQVGTGTLVSFVEDTLRGKPHLAISANVKDRSGVEQLKRLAAALFVEGGEIRWEKLGVSSKRQTERLALGVPLVKHFTPLAILPEERPTSPELDTSVEEVLRGAPPEVAREFENVLRGVVDAQRSVVEALTKKSPPSLGERESTFDISLSVDAFPELLDHCFFRQPEGWMNVTDRHPIVPMTASIDWMIDAAQKLVPERVAVGLENMQALRWIVASVPTSIHVTTKFDGVDRVHVAFEGYCEAIVVLTEKYGDPPIAQHPALRNSSRPAIDAHALYADRWMFHGPQYQGVVALDSIGDDGILGTLEAKKAAGALLDNAGQLFGFWVMAKNEANRMALPVHIDKIDFYGPRPEAGERFACDVRIRKQDERSVVADLTLTQDGEVWAKITGWEDRRFDTDARLWNVMLHPERHALAAPDLEGFTLFDDTYRAASTRDQLARRYLGEAEREQYENQGPRNQRAWLNGRIAAKDAIRNLFWQRDADLPIFPVEIEIFNDASGGPIASCAFDRDVRISIAHKEDMAIAMATIGKRVGVDVEKIETRSASFEEISFTPEELALVDADARDEWITRLWSAKEAAAKARGTGLVGNPRRFVIRDRSGERLLVDDILVETRRHGDFILSWTVS